MIFLNIKIDHNVLFIRMFSKLNLESIRHNIFDELSTITEFEDICEGRKGAVLVDCKNDLIPLVRTTTNYHKSSQRFQPIHYDIFEKIKSQALISLGMEVDFNNALIEVYTLLYATMGYHSDQAQDLNPNSYIGVFSCYENEAVDLRKLKIKNKTTNTCSEIIMDHCSVVLFSVDTNSRFLHKILLQ